MIKNREKIRLILLHIALICGIVILTAGILDWYNPYMNFSGQIKPLEILQVVDLIILALTVGRQKAGRRTEMNHYRGKRRIMGRNK